MVRSAAGPAARLLAGALILSCVAACATWRTPIHPALTAAARRDGPLAVHDALEALIEAGQDTPADREFAYEAVRANREDSAAASFARAAITGRLVQQQALRGAHLVARVEREAERSRELDPDFRGGAATRLLGTLYVAAPATLLARGDSEQGLALLQALAAARPEHLENHLRLAEAYLALGDPGPAAVPLCRCRGARDLLRRDERVLLDRLVEQAGPLDCGAGLDVAAPRP